jgi:hypothetical protein
MNVTLSKATLKLLAACTELQAELKAYEERSPDDCNVKAHSLIWERLSSNARMLAMSLEADKATCKEVAV